MPAFLDNTIRALLDEQAAHAATKAERDHWHRAAKGAEETSAKTEAENAALRAELATLQARAAKAIAATIPGSPDLPPRAVGDVRDGVMTEEDLVWEVLRESAGMTPDKEPRLFVAVHRALTEAHNKAARANKRTAKARRLCKVLVDEIIDE